MIKIDFNTDWLYKRLEDASEWSRITVPHDAMLCEKRSLQSDGMHNTGWFEGYDYVYMKYFDVPEGYSKVIAEFEGIYHNAEIYLNGQMVEFRPYGYTDFFVDISEYLKKRDNEMRIIARNADQPNSRWYTGSGIYRPVWLYLSNENYILPNGVKVKTLKCDYENNKALIEVSVKANYEYLEGEAGNTFVVAKIYDDNGKLVSKEERNSRKSDIFEIEINDAKYWDTENPDLYKCCVSLIHKGNNCKEEILDEHCVKFGIRELNWNPESGFCVNGKRTILKGACIHHDNGLLGACAYPEAEKRKIRILKENGYNAIRSAHNPCSKALLEACDSLGMFVMDEYVDMWYIHKNKYDYASYMKEWWKRDLYDMVEKDYNHPCVVMYSTGNEVAETGQKEGIELTAEMTEFLHGLDDTRPVTCGVNIFFNFLYSMGFGVYSDEKAEKESTKPKEKKKTVGSEFYNTLAGLLGDKMMKIGATLHMCDVKTRDAFAAMDIAGYNYGIKRYKHDLKKYKNRLILGSETFCKDAYEFLEFAKKNPRIVGDFVWAGMDYIGEAGIGSWEYEDYAPKNADSSGWLTAGSGRINILGVPNGEAMYTRVALEKEKGPYIVVKPVYQTGKHSPSAWKMTDAMESWTWPGCEGRTAEVEIYARAYSVELKVNGITRVIKKLTNTCRIKTKLKYEPGEITCISKDVNGNEIGRKSLITAGNETKLTLISEKMPSRTDELCYIRIMYTDNNGIIKPMEKHRINAMVSNGKIVGFGNACPYNPDGYLKNETFTYYGEAMAIIKMDKDEKCVLRVSDESRSSEIEIDVERKGETLCLK